MNDPATARKVPACYRASFEKMRKDTNFELALENADMASRMLYEDQVKEVGGDFYDFFLIDETHLGPVMADVSGKGVPTALFMMISKILVKNYAMTGWSPSETMRAVNEQLCAGNPEEMFVTLWLGILDTASGRITAANSGHEYPTVMQTGQRFVLVKDKHCFVIGGMESMKYKEYELTLPPGSRLFFYTVGCLIPFFSEAFPGCCWSVPVNRPEQVYSNILYFGGIKNGKVNKPEDHQGAGYPQHHRRCFMSGRRSRHVRSGRHRGSQRGSR